MSIPRGAEESGVALQHYRASLLHQLRQRANRTETPGGDRARDPQASSIMRLAEI